MKRVFYDPDGNPAGEMRTVRNNGKPLGSGPLGQGCSLIAGLFLAALFVAGLIALVHG